MKKRPIPVEQILAYSSIWGKTFDRVGQVSLDQAQQRTLLFAEKWLSDSFLVYKTEYDPKCIYSVLS